MRASATKPNESASTGLTAPLSAPTSLEKFGRKKRIFRASGGLQASSIAYFGEAP